MKNFLTIEKGLFPAFVAIAASVLITGSAALWANPNPSNSGTPALRSIHEDRSILVLGASIGQFPQGGGAEAVRTLRRQHRQVPWKRMIIWRLPANGTVVERLWLPASTMREAFALCSQFAADPLECAPVVTPSNQLRTLDGNAVGEVQLPDLGIAPYRPVTGLWTKVV